MVSICCLTYNHAGYIGECLEGIFLQKFNFPYEILIHDDASTDGTQEIIREYEQKYPEVVKPIYQTENQFSKGVRSISARFNFPRAKGKYIAMCEGDDYWSDPFKLSRQIELLEGNPELMVSAENSMVLKDSGSKTIFGIKPGRVVSESELVKSRQFATGSIVFRNNVDFEYLITDLPAGDTTLLLYLNRFGKVHYNDIISSTYRRGNHGITETLLNNELKEQLVKFFEFQNEMTEFKHNDFFRKKILITVEGNSKLKFEQKIVNIFARLISVNQTMFFDWEFDSLQQKIGLLLKRRKFIINTLATL